MLPRMPAARRPTEVVLEVTRRRSFASAVDWPGWCRAGTTVEAALEELASYAPRYARVAAVAGVRFAAGAGDELTVVEQLPGDATTTFGAPGIVAAADRRPLTAAEAARQARLLRASWDELARVGRDASPALRKGPRGGGRDRDGVVAHVIEAERSYARRVGVRHPPFHGDAAALEACRSELEQVLRSARSGDASDERGWPPQYFVRRAAWHVLDHVWEIEDKASNDVRGAARGR
jgi:hypothetical protein